MIFTQPVAALPWNTVTPVVYRHLEKPEWVDAFFADGSLRVSSIKKFRTHKDERRLDKSEGWAHFMHRTSENGGQSIGAWMGFGHDGYTLSTSTRTDAKLQEKFGPCIRIDDTSQFGIAVSRCIPGFAAGFEAHCWYLAAKGMDVDLGFVDLEQLKNDKGELNGNELFALMWAKMQHWPAFMKHSDFAAEAEYRFLWQTKEPIEEYLDLKVPEARQFCSRPSRVTEGNP